MIVFVLFFGCEGIIAAIIVVRNDGLSHPVNVLGLDEADKSLPDRGTW